MEDAPAKSRTCFRVLIIDDSPADRELMTLQLGQAWPFQRDLVVDYADDGAEALQKLGRQRFTLVLLDWRLPEVDGGEVLRRIRQNGVRIPVVVVSGLDREDLGADLDQLASAYLNKDQMDSTTFHDAIAKSLELLNLTQPPAAA